MKLEFCELRERCGLDLADVAAEFGAPFDAVFRWESGENSPPERILRSLSIMADFSARPAPLPTISTPRERKAQLGQFMTPTGVADFMAALFAPPAPCSVRLLDAGAGQGALATAFIERVKGSMPIAVSAFEFDGHIVPDLRDNLAALGQRANVGSEIIEADFIEEAANRICLGRGERYTRHSQSSLQEDWQ